MCHVTSQVGAVIVNSLPITERPKACCIWERYIKEGKPCLGLDGLYPKPVVQFDDDTVIWG